MGLKFLLSGDSLRIYQKVKKVISWQAVTKKKSIYSGYQMAKKKRDFQL
jgi:hypothetical protein